MSVVADAAKMLETALEVIPETGNTVRRLGEDITSTPAVVLGPPALQWEAGCPSPTSARFLAYAIEAADERAVERLWDLVEVVGDAIDDHTQAVVISADPAVYVAGTSQLPCYEIVVEVPL